MNWREFLQLVFVMIMTVAASMVLFWWIVTVISYLTDTRPW